MANEQRLIDAEKAWKTAQRIYSDPVLLHVIKNTLDSTDTVDAVEVIHASWVDVRDYCGDYMCSNCKELYRTKTYNYCPNCGARMDGGVSDG